MGNNRKSSASCILIKEKKLLLIKHTYGAAKRKYLIPGRFCEENETLQVTAEREVLEETVALAKANELAAASFTPQQC